jgi:superfamily II DNA or RNA helicase
METGIALRPYQEAAIEAWETRLNGGLRRGIINLPTGCGKTVTGLAIAKRRGGRTLWLAHRDELIEQPLRAIRAVWPEASTGVVKAERNETDAQMVFGSIQTVSRANRLRALSGFDQVVVDEAHHAAADTYMRTMDALGCFKPDGPPVLGLTATVERGDSIGLDKSFEAIVYQMQLLQAVKDGWLVDLRMQQVALDFDLDSIPTVNGDYNQGELGNAMLRAGAAEATANAYQNYGAGRKALIFTVTVDQARRTAEELQSRGEFAEWLCGNTPIEERRSILQRFKTGETQIVANCAVLTEGFDEPSVDAILIARPTQSKTLYLQMIGRGTRIFPGKEDCLIIDLAGASRKHKLVQAPVLFGLDPDEANGETVTEALEKKRKREDALVSSLVTANRALPERRQFHWTTSENAFYAASAGRRGTVMLIRSGDGWIVEVSPKDRLEAPTILEPRPVDLEMAQGIGEDYIRRAMATVLAAENAGWRLKPASEKLLAALSKWRVQVPSGITAGAASDLLTIAIAKAWLWRRKQ